MAFTDIINRDLLKKALTEFRTKLIETLTGQDLAVSSADSTKIATAIADMGVFVASIPTITSLPYTLTQTGIDESMVVVGYTLGTPRAQASTWTVTTADGSLTIEGTLRTTTSLTLYLSKSR